jgi:hypothetical protein
MAASNDLVIDQYATFKTAFRWETKSSGQPVNLTGYTAAMQIRRTPADATALVSLTSAANGGLTIEGTAGRVRIEIPSTTTATLTPGRYVYDLVLTDLASKKKRLVEGVVIVDAGVTR